MDYFSYHNYSKHFALAKEMAPIYLGMYAKRFYVLISGGNSLIQLRKVIKETCIHLPMYKAKPFKPSSSLAIHGYSECENCSNIAVAEPTGTYRSLFIIH